MSQPRPIRKENKLVHIRTYLIGKGYNPNHFSAMMKFAGKKVYATKEEWDKIFSQY